MRGFLRREEGRLCLVYVFVAAATLWLSGRYGETMSVIDSALGIGLVIAIRSRLHELWTDRNMPLRFLVLVLVAGGGVWLVNLNNPKIAFASLIAFFAANGAGTYCYELVKSWPRSRRMAFVAVVFAGVDSLVFPTLAFGQFDVGLAVAQFVAKVGGAYVYAQLLFGRRRVAPRA